MKKEYHYFLGINVSKETLDYTLLREEEVLKQGIVPNTTYGVAKLGSELERLQIPAREVLFCCESIGLYSAVLALACQQAGYPLWVENALAIKRSMGLTQEKDEAIDSYRIALYGSRFQAQHRPYELPVEAFHRLWPLVVVRSQLLKALMEFEQGLQKMQPRTDRAAAKLFKEITKELLSATKEAMAKVEKEMKEQIAKTK